MALGARTDVLALGSSPQRPRLGTTALNLLGSQVIPLRLVPVPEAVGRLEGIYFEFCFILFQYIVLLFSK
jgi:hypothetical protein